MASNKNHSIEEIVEDWCKSQFGSQKYYTKTENINSEIEDALKKAPSKQGGPGTNYPDIKCIIETATFRRIPVMIEVKGTKDNLEKLDEFGKPDNRKKDGSPNFQNITKYAVNGAIHYANAILQYTQSYKSVIAIGVNGYYLPDGTIKHEVSVWYISKENLFIPKYVDDYSDLSFLQKKYRSQLEKKLSLLSLTSSEIEKEKIKLEDDIERKLKDLNQKMEDELKIVVNARVQLVTGLIMAGLGVPDGGNDSYKVFPLQVEDLKGESGKLSNDGVVVMNKISSYLSEKQLPEEKIQMIENVLNNVFVHSKLQEPINGESRLKTIYRDIQTNIIPFLTGELHNIDFTGRLFNVLNAWVAVPDGAENDVVLTPRYVTELMARLCRVNKDSYVWDFATGSAGFLISAMHQMIADAQSTINSPSELQEVISHIKMEQLLGIEKLPDIYLLAVLNMILMKDGSANIIHGDSLTQFNGSYEQGDLKGKKFPADVFLLNPPYSAEGKGFVFVHKALSMMDHGMAAVLIQENAGSGKGVPYTKEILKNNTLLASVKMSEKLFFGKSTVQTAIYVFEVGKAHSILDMVRFIDFSNDGYTRMNRRHSSQSVNLRDTDHAQERYDEIATLVRYGKGLNNENLHYFKDYFVEDHITLDGDDWTYGQHRKINATPSPEDYSNIVKDYLSWRVNGEMKKEDILNSIVYPNSLPMSKIGYRKYKIGDLFEIKKGTRLTKAEMTSGNINFIGASSSANGITAKISNNKHLHPAGTITVTYNGSVGEAFYQTEEFWASDDVNVLYPKFKMSEKVALYFLALLRKKGHAYGYSFKWTKDKMKNDTIELPINKSGEIDFHFIEKTIFKLEKNHVRELKKEYTHILETYLKIAGINSIEIIND